MSPRTGVEIARDLRRLGLAAADVVVVHASLRAIGPVERGAATVVSSILDAVGRAGTLMAYVDFEPTAEVPHFDPARSPACREYGVLAETIRSWPGAARSLNPGASVSAVGAHADWLCADHSLDYGHGPRSPLQRLVDLDGKVLLLGSDLDQVTLLHLAEHLASLPGKRVVRGAYRVAREGEIAGLSFEEFDTARPVLDSMPERVFEDVLEAYLAAGRARSGRVGEAESQLLRAGFAVAWFEEHFAS